MLDSILLLIGLLFLSAIFSGSETAFFLLRPSDINICRRSSRLYDRWLLLLHRDLTNFLYTILLGNLIINITYFALAASVSLQIQKLYGDGWAIAVNLLALLLLIVISEVIPKALGSALSIHLCRLTSIPLFILHRLLSPLTLALRKITKYFERAFLPSAPLPAAQENLQLLFEHYRAEGLVTHSEYLFINTVIELNDIRVNELITPRVDMIAVAYHATPELCLQLARESGHSKLPVRGENSEQLIGWLDVREFFFAENTSTKIIDHLKPFIFLSEFSTAANALKAFLQSGIRLAVVIDERGADGGILVLTDIIAEIFGEFGEGGMPARELVRKTGDDHYWFDGRVSTRTLKEVFDLHAPLPKVSTIGGLVTALLGRPAKINDVVKLDNIIITVAEIRHHRPLAVTIKLQK